MVREPRRCKKYGVRAQRKATSLRIVRQNPTSVSHDTLYRLLKEKSITNWLCKKRPLLTSKVAGKRYAWALAHEDWGFDEWARVIWSDECSVERGTSKRREWCFRTLAQK